MNCVPFRNPSFKSPFILITKMKKTKGTHSFSFCFLFKMKAHLLLWRLQLPSCVGYPAKQFPESNVIVHARSDIIAHAYEPGETAWKTNEIFLKACWKSLCILHSHLTFQANSESSWVDLVHRYGKVLWMLKVHYIEAKYYYLALCICNKSIR